MPTFFEKKIFTPPPNEVENFVSLSRPGRSGAMFVAPMLNTPNGWSFGLSPWKTKPTW